MEITNIQPLVSVVMPVYNTEKYVREAVESVLAQTYPHIELICCDDGSTDGSLGILRTFGERICVVENAQNGGIAQARNNAIAVAKGAYIACMDADDIWKPEKISAQMQQFQDDLQLNISFTYAQCFVSPELSDEIKQTRQCPTDPIPGYMSATAMIQRDCFETVGYFDPKWRVGEFIDWFERAKALGMRYNIIHDALYLRRIHGSNTGVTARDSRVDYVRIVKEALDRKRAQQ